MRHHLPTADLALRPPPGTNDPLRLRARRPTALRASKDRTAASVDLQGDLPSPASPTRIALPCSGDPACRRAWQWLPRAGHVPRSRRPPCVTSYLAHYRCTGWGLSAPARSYRPSRNVSATTGIVSTALVRLRSPARIPAPAAWSANAAIEGTPIPASQPASLVGRVRPGCWRAAAPPWRRKDGVTVVPAATLSGGGVGGHDTDGPEGRGRLRLGHQTRRGVRGR